MCGVSEIMSVSRYMAANLCNNFIWQFGHEDRFEVEEEEDFITIRKQSAKERIPHERQKGMNDSLFALKELIDAEI